MHPCGIDMLSWIIAYTVLIKTMQHISMFKGFQKHSNWLKYVVSNYFMNL